MESQGTRKIFRFNFASIFERIFVFRLRQDFVIDRLHFQRFYFNFNLSGQFLYFITLFNNDMSMQCKSLKNLKKHIFVTSDMIICAMNINMTRMMNRRKAGVRSEFGRQQSLLLFEIVPWQNMGFRQSAPALPHLNEHSYF